VSAPRSPLVTLEWQGDGEPTPERVASRLRAEGVEPYAWSNGPGDRYPLHSHSYEKVLMCAEGSIIFLIGKDRSAVELRAGEGFILPAGTSHAAEVGPRGCTCLEGHRPAG
jgi:quercetin dioxygenase-like cupin family protein